MQIAAATSAPAPAASRSPSPARGLPRQTHWYLFLVVLAMSSFSIVNLALKTDITASVGSGVMAAVGLAAVVILLLRD